jgi:hypothetical protein
VGGTFSDVATTTNSDSGTLTYSISSGTACTSAGGGTFNITGAGTCVVRADGALTTNYNAAFNTDTVVITKASQIISFTGPGTGAVGGTYTPAGTATSTLPVTFTIDSGSSTVCHISAGVVTYDTVGTCTINADQAGNANYDAAPQVQQPVTVS